MKKTLPLLAALTLLAPASALASAPATPAPKAAAERVLSQEVTVKAPRGEVWRAFTTAEGVRTFFSPAAHVELKPGGRYEILFDPSAPRGAQGCEGCRVLSYVPEELLSFSWSAPPSFPELRWQKTFVVVQLADAGAGQTRVKLTQAGWREGAEWDKLYDYFGKAWPMVLGNLRKRFETGPLWPQPKEAQAAAPVARKHYVYYIRPARAGFFKQTTPAEEKVMGEHVAYIKGLLGQGRLVLAGPSFEPTHSPEGSALALDMAPPGIVVFEAEGDEEARRIMEGDPAVKAGVFKAQVNPFKLSFSR
jgi:uncharacterized protein YndB with AHSA1/START domain/uncharacterized protein YciI